MNKQKRRILALVLSLSMVLSLFHNVGIAYAEEPTETEDTLPEPAATKEEAFITEEPVVTEIGKNTQEEIIEELPEVTKEIQKELSEVTEIPEATEEAKEILQDEDGAYILTKPEDFAFVRENLHADFKLGSDINFEGADFTPIGTMEEPFEGTFDGAGYQISNISILDEEKDSIGFFGSIKNAAIQNVNFDTVEVAGKEYVGALVGYVQGSSKNLTNCVLTKVQVKGMNYVGGMIGSTDQESTVSSIIIHNSSVSGTIFATKDRVGGIAGYIKGGIKNSNIDATVKGNDYVGGIIGNSKGGTIEACYTKGSITGNNYVGGLVGLLNGGAIEKCYNTAAIIGNNYAGGLVGESNGGTIENSFVISTVQGSSYVGGMIGQCTTVTYLINCYASALTLSKDNNVGGLCSKEDNLIINSSYFDMSVSELDEQATSSAGKTTDELRLADTYATWNLQSIWAIEEGAAYPYIVDLPIPDGINGPAPEAEQQGNGTQEDPYIITTKKQLKAIAENVSAFYKLGADLNLGGIEWEPIGTSTAPFTGGLDGAGYTISNFTIAKSTANNVGFFGVIKEAVIKNLNFDYVTVTGKSYVGTLAGLVQGTAWSIQNVAVSNGNINAVSYAGGLIGSLAAASTEPIANCSFHGNVIAAGTRAAGLVSNLYGNLVNCYVTGSVSGTTYIGGLAGYSYGDADITTSYSTANVTGTNYVAGLVGYKVKGTIQDSFAAGTMKGAKYVGGILGAASGAVTIKNCYAAISLNASSTIRGGIVGATSNVTNTASYYDATVSQIISSDAINMSKTTSALLKQATYKEWNFDSVWGIQEDMSYPYLLNLPAPTIEIEKTQVKEQGSGTQKDPYRIYTAEDIVNIHYERDAYYILMNDIDLQGMELTPIGTASVPFTGNFNGNGFTISNFTINKNVTDYVGFFGVVNNAVITKVTISNAYITGRNYVGSLIGCAKGENRVITECNVIGGSVTGTSYVGGLVGYTTQVSQVNITSCYTDTTVKGTTYIGGLIGYLYGGVSQCYVLGQVDGTNDVGGLIGYSYSASAIETSYSAASITGTNRIGGLIGTQNLANTILNCYVLGSVSGTAYIGGILGTSTKVVTISNCYVAGAVTAVNTTAGGLTGNVSKVAVTNSFYDGIAVGIKSTNALQVSLITSTMKKQATYVGWDFENVWKIDEGISYPYLMNLPKPEEADKETSVSVSKGSGTQEDPYLIYTAEQLKAVQFETSAYYQLAADIDLEGQEWNPAGSPTVPFCGGFDGSYKGENYVIRNLTISQGVKENVGFFGVISNAELRNITIENAKINGKNYVGGLVGKVTGTKNIIENCSITDARITGTSYIGGLAGYVVNAGNEPIIKCTVEAEVIGTEKYAGILVGYFNGKVKHCSTSGTVEATSYIGGIAGYSNAGTIEECYSNIRATDGTYVGGIVGLQAKGTVINCYALGFITGTNQIGGLIGNVSGKSYVSNSYSGVVIDTNGTSVGGIAPYNSSLVLTSCYYDGEKAGIVPKTLYDFSYLTQTMLDASLYKDWDFEQIWSMGEGSQYPSLQAMHNQNTKVLEEERVVFEGTGSESEPYIISTAEQLNLIRYERNACYQLANDIDLQYENWLSIGLNTNAPFTGKFDGNGHVISNFIISESSSNNIGFFGVINNAEIQNLTIKGARVTGKTNVGTLIGYVAGTTWNIKDCHSLSSRVAATSYAGGLIGIVASTGKHAILKVTADAEVIVSGIRAGGIVGSMAGNIIESYAMGTVQGDDYVGGIAGYYAAGSIEKCYYAGSITGDLSVGGLIGTKASASGSIVNCYTLGTVKGTNNVGGIIGSIGAAAAITNCYSASEIVSKGTNVYGIYGAKGKGIITNCYYNRTINPDIKVVEANARYTSALKRQANFVDWDFDEIWRIEEYRTYPFLNGMTIPEGIEGAPAEDLPEGSGTKEDPYIIKTKQHLISVQYNLAAYYEVVNDIDLEGMEWTPLGTVETPFTGHINGNGFTIKNFSIYSTSLEYAGLFGVAENAEIVHLNIAEVTLSGGNYVGALAGYVFGENAYIEDCHVVSGTITGTDYVGGLIGKFEGKGIVKCSTAIAVYAADYVGGIVGYLNGTISMCYASGSVEANKYVGGIVGYAVTIIVKNSFTLGMITGADYTGGIIGYCETAGTITNCYVAAKIICQGTQVGGIYGVITNITAENSYYDGIVTTIVPLCETDCSRLTSGLCNAATYTGWDFTNIWTIDADTSYPYLRGITKPANVSNISISGSPTGIGTKENPYVITTAEQLIHMKFELSAYYKLGSDIDLSEIDWIPLGTKLLPFTGYFDGCGYTITGLAIHNEELDYAALFGIIKNATIMNLNITCVNMAGHAYVGALVGIAYGEENYIYNCTVVKGTITGVDYVGGLIGKIEGGIIEKCSTKLDIQATGYYLGGIVGYLAGTLKLSYSESMITGNYYVGGLAGYGYYAVIEVSYFASTVKGYYYIGGIVGAVSSAVIQNCHILGWVDGTRYVGGIVGISVYDSTILYCYAASKITVLEMYVGGLVSVNEYITVIASYYDGLLSGIERTYEMDNCKLSGSLKYSVTYKEWDFAEVWTIEEGETYAYLRQLPKPSIVAGEIMIGSPKGAGTKDNPYVIQSPDELKNLKYELDAYFILGGNIDLEGIEWTPIGTRVFPFEGHFDGNGYAISNFKITQESSNDVGFFGAVKNAVITNLTLSDMNIKGKHYVGALAGYAEGEDMVINSCLIDGNVEGENYVGGIAGYLRKGTISNSGSIATINGNSYVGGITGYNFSGTMKQCECVATVAGSYYTGGITGYCNTGIITSCESFATVTGKSYIGGIAGYNNGATVSICTKLADTEGDVLPLIKEKNDTVLTELSYSFATVTGTTYVGGIIGYSYGGTALSCFSDGSITGKVYVGGVIGYSISAAVEDCQNNSTVEGNRYTNDMVGYTK